MNNKIRKILLLLTLSFLLLNSTGSVNTTANNKFITAVDNVKFVSSLLEGQKMLPGNVMVQSFRNLTIVEKETYSAIIIIKNTNSYISNTNASIEFSYSGLKVEKTITLSDWEVGTVLNITIPKLPAPSVMDWRNALTTVHWTFLASDNIKNFDLKIPIIPKAQNFIPPVQINVDQNSMENKSYSPIELSSSDLTIVDMWEGALRDYESIYSKGSGPTIWVQIMPNVRIIGQIGITYYLHSYTHGWSATYTYYFYGTYYAGLLYTLKMELIWLYNIQYSFGQGEYQVTRANVFGSTFSEFIYRNNIGDDFKIEQSPSQHVVFLVTMYDSWIQQNNPNCLDRSEGQFISEAISNIESVFPIKYYYLVFPYNWLGSHGGILRWGYHSCGGYSQMYVADENKDQLLSASSAGLKHILGLNLPWDYVKDPNYITLTQKNNHGFDQAFAMSGLIRSYNSNHDYKTGWGEGSLAYALPGFEIFVLEFFYWFVFDSNYDNLIQHEMGHNWGASHDDSNSNIMNTDLCSCTNWNTLAMTQFMLNQYDYPPIE